jgi:hypothetical protein
MVRLVLVLDIVQKLDVMPLEFVSPVNPGIMVLNVYRNAQ